MAGGDENTKNGEDKIVFTEDDKKAGLLIVHPSEPMQFLALFLDQAIILPGIMMDIAIELDDERLRILDELFFKRLDSDTPVAIVCLQGRENGVAVVRKVATLGYMRSHSRETNNGSTIVMMRLEAVDRVKIVSLSKIVSDEHVLDLFFLKQAEAVHFPDPRVTEAQWRSAISNAARQALIENVNLWSWSIESLIILRKENGMLLSAEEDIRLKLLSSSLMSMLISMERHKDLPSEFMDAVVRFMQTQAPFFWKARYLEADSVMERVDIVLDMARQSLRNLYDVIDALEALDDQPDNRLPPPSLPQKQKKDDGKIAAGSLDGLKQQAGKLLKELDRMIKQLSTPPSK